MKVSLMAAKSLNGVIGNASSIPWTAKGEQLLFKAITYNQWLIVGRKTFESDGMGQLPNRKYAVISRSDVKYDNNYVLVFKSIEAAIKALSKVTDHVIVAGGGEIYRQTVDLADVIHLSTIETDVQGDVMFPELPNNFELAFEQKFESNINYTYQIWKKYETSKR